MPHAVHDRADDAHAKHDAEQDDQTDVHALFDQTALQGWSARVLHQLALFARVHHDTVDPLGVAQCAALGGYNSQTRYSDLTRAQYLHAAALVCWTTNRSCRPVRVSHRTCRVCCWASHIPPRLSARSTVFCLATNLSEPVLDAASNWFHWMKNRMRILTHIIEGQ
jgi:hypothetical protein